MATNNLTLIENPLSILILDGKKNIINIRD